MILPIWWVRLTTVIVLTLTGTTSTAHETAPTLITPVTPDCEIALQIDRQSAEDAAMELLISLEGFLSRPVWDVNAYRNGHGTPAKHPNELIDRIEARARSLRILRKHFGHLRLSDPHLSERQLAALAVMRYNVGSFGPGLTQAVASGDTDRIATQMRRYTKSAGNHLDGLEIRRELEINLMRDKVLEFAK